MGEARNGSRVRDEPLSMKVSELIDQEPWTVQLFIARRMACVGCAFSRFMTLERALLTYGLDPQKFVAEINHGPARPEDVDMGIIWALLGEHAVLFSLFEVVEGRLSDCVDKTELLAAARPLTDSLARHARVEDEVFFQPLEEQLGPVAPVAVMRQEHDEIEAALAQLQEVESLEEGMDILHRTLRTAREHFLKEQEILFPHALQALDEGELQRMASSWAERSGVPAPPGG